MVLESYRKKRDFKKSPEPKGEKSVSQTKLAFVIHRHKATALHYDLRLEVDGVLKSWAVPKGPSMNPEDKRLAIMVEDHPYEYKDFKGKIPVGNYGAGLVEIWDNGTYTYVDSKSKTDSEKSMREGLKKGAIKIKLNGKKLKGEFALAKMKSRTEKDNTWLLIKHADDYAISTKYNSEDYTSTNSPINKLLKEKKNPPQKNAHKPRVKAKRATSKKKGFIPAMLAKETNEAFDDKEWIYEIKWDGYRAMAEANDAHVELYSRYGNRFNDAYPEIVEALSKLKINAILDGEIVVLNEEGVSDFQLLQNYDGKSPIKYYTFDLLAINGKKIMNLPLIERKKRLKKLLKKNKFIQYSDHILKDGIAFFDVAGKKGLEGIIAKQVDSTYQPGKRTSNWLKIKHHHTQEAIIAGYTDPTGSRKYFGSLVLAVYERGKLKYIGNAGTGFKEKDLKNIYDLLRPLKRKTSPFNETIDAYSKVTWLRPKIVCEIKYSEKTKDDKLRHPVFLRIREQKTAKDITSKSQSIMKNPSSEISNKQDAKTSESELRFGNIKVPISNADKIFWPNEKITKRDVVDYYQEISKYILPHLKDKPQSLKRNPNGIKDKGFYQKDAGEDAPEWVNTKKIYSESTKKDVHYIICNTKATLAYLNNLGCIELNPWHSKISSLDKPDYFIIDIDPDDKNSFDDVVEVAIAVKEVMDLAGGNCYCKTSGATGIHVYVPVNKKYSYEQVRDFAHLICAIVNEQLPELTTLERRLNKRKPKKVYLDYLQNSRGQTIAAPYSVRPVKGATVSMPLEWKEIKKGISPSDFTIKNALKRIKTKGDIFKPVLGKGINLEKCIKKLNDLHEN